MVATIFGSSTKPVEKEGLPTTAFVNITARTAQAFFSSGIVFSALGITSHAVGILTGGSFLFHGSFVIVRLIETVVCFDLARIAANIASIWKSSFVGEWTKVNLGDTAADVIQKAETFFSPPENILKGLKDNRSYLNAINHGTYFAHLLNPYITDLLSKTERN